MENLKNFIMTDDIDPENKKEHELNTNDRMILMNKKIDENIITNIYSDIIDKQNLTIKNDVCMNDYVFNDIEFFNDYYLNDKNSIFSKINNCKTQIGKLLFKKLLLNPISNIKILKERQNIIQNIKSAKNELIPLMNEISILENDLIWFWNNNNMKHIDLLNDMIYFNYDFIPFFNVNDILNNSEKALMITNIYKIIVSPFLTFITPIISVLFPLIILLYFKRKTNINIPISVIIKQYFNTLFGHDSMNMIFKEKYKAVAASLVTKGIYIFMYFQNIYYSFQNANNTHKIINTIHDKLNKMSKYHKMNDKIIGILNKYKINNLSSYYQHTNIIEDITFYEPFFESTVFDYEPSLFSNKGKILYVFKEFKKNKQNMTNLFHLTGIIDSILSIERLLSNSNNSNPYSLCNYLTNNKPTILFKNIWHPYLNTEKTVKNSVDIKNNILITGPNAAGKSTFIKSVIINILLAQTIGISSSEKFEITPFDHIETYLHIPDSKGTSSLFEAEMNRSKDYIEKIKNMDTNKFSFIVLDEIFSSTNYVEGFSGAYSILKKISSYSNTMSITTTHYTDLEILEKDTKGKISNYKFEIEYDKKNNNEIIFNYKLQKGVSRQYIALELLKKNGFDEDILNDAILMSNKIKNNKLIKKTKKVKK